MTQTSNGRGPLGGRRATRSRPLSASGVVTPAVHTRGAPTAHSERGSGPIVTTQERFWGRVEMTSSCWLWTGSRDRHGYGSLYWSGSTRRAHRVAYEIAVGPIPEGLDLDHLCRTRACVRPDHLEPVDRRTNLLRGEAIQARNARKTHCVRGHEFTIENTARRQNGARRCRECRRTRSAPMARCSRGHAYEGDNVIVDRRGWRVCRECRNARRRERRAVASEIASSTP